jgi:hypothetical protein
MQNLSGIHLGKISYSKLSDQNKSGNEYHYTTCSFPEILKNSCSELHRLKVPNRKAFSYQILGQIPRGDICGGLFLDFENDGQGLFQRV